MGRTKDAYAVQLAGGNGHSVVGTPSDLGLQVGTVGLRKSDMMDLLDIHFPLPIQADMLHMAPCSSWSIAHSCSWACVNFEPDDVVGPD